LVVPLFQGRCSRILIGKTRRAYPNRVQGVVFLSDLLALVVPLSWGRWLSVVCGMCVVLLRLCSCQFGVFLPCCVGLFRFSLGRSAPGVAVVGGALTGIIYQKRECWLVFNSVSSCVFANFATVRCRIHSRFCLEGMVCSIVVLMLWRRK
jgi:hypothetical protein